MGKGIVGKVGNVGAGKSGISQFSQKGGKSCSFPTFLGMEIEQSNRSIKLHRDHYVRELSNEYKAYIKKSLLT